MTCGSPATARSDSAPMLPKLVRVAVPPAELKTTPAEGRPPKFPVGSEPTLVRSACQPPITDPPDGMLTLTLPPPVPLIPGLAALIPTLNCPGVDTFVAVTCTLPVVELAQMPCDTSPCVEIAPDAAPTLMLPFSKRVVPEVDIAGGRIVVDSPAEIEVKPDPEKESTTEAQRHRENEVVR